MITFKEIAEVPCGNTFVVGATKKATAPPNGQAIHGAKPPAGGFHGLSDDEWSSLLKAPPPPPNPYDKPAKSGSAAKALKAASKGNEEEKKEKKKSAASFLNSSRGLLIFMGSIKIAFSLYYFLQAKKTAETIIGSDPDLAEGSEMIVFILQLIHGVGIATVPVSSSLA